jgi:hypothetical protein
MGIAPEVILLTNITDTSADFYAWMQRPMEWTMHFGVAASFDLDKDSHYYRKMGKAVLTGNSSAALQPFEQWVRRI